MTQNTIKSFQSGKRPKMYTTFERISFNPSETVPSERRLHLGIQPVKMEAEWSGDNFRINFGE